MSRASQVIVLCEDKLHRTFVTRFLKQHGYMEREFRVQQCPGGTGAAEHFVRSRYPVLLKACRARTAKTFLIAMIDADKGSVADHEKQLTEACEAAGVPPRQHSDKVVHVIPRRAINTWLAFLAGGKVDEETDYKREGYDYRRCESSISSLVRGLYETCARNEVPRGAPPSLEQACREFGRIKDELR